MFVFVFKGFVFLAEVGMRDSPECRRVGDVYKCDF